MENYTKTEKKYSGERMEKVSGGRLGNNYSGWLQMENCSGLRTEKDSGELQMEN